MVMIVIHDGIVTSKHSIACLLSIISFVGIVDHVTFLSTRAVPVQVCSFMFVKLPTNLTAQVNILETPGLFVGSFVCSFCTLLYTTYVNSLYSPPSP